MLSFKIQDVKVRKFILYCFNDFQILLIMGPYMVVIVVHCLRFFKQQEFNLVSQSFRSRKIVFERFQLIFLFRNRPFYLTSEGFLPFSIHFLNWTKSLFKVSFQKNFDLIVFCLIPVCFLLIKGVLANFNSTIA